MSLHLDPQQKPLIDIELLANKIALNLKNYYALPEKFAAKEAFNQLSAHLVKSFSEIIRNLPSAEPQQYKENFMVKANEILHQIDQHLEIALAANNIFFQRLLKHEGKVLQYNETKETAYFPAIVSSPPKPTEEELKKELENLEKSNCDFNLNPEIQLPENIGYVKLLSFKDPYTGAEKGDPNALVARRANEIMASMQGKDALIFDLRGCPGGSPELVRLLISYFFAEDTPINKYYRPIDGNTEIFNTIKTSFSLNMPVFILIDAETFSAGESFAYAMQQFNKFNIQDKQRKIILIGEKTGGGAHRWGQFPILEIDPKTHDIAVNKDWVIMLPIVNNINAYSGTNWEDDGTKGVVPEILISKNQNALEIALKMALTKTRQAEQLKTPVFVSKKLYFFNEKTISLKEREDSEKKSSEIHDQSLSPRNKQNLF